MRKSLVIGLCVAALLAVMPGQSGIAEEAVSQPSESGDHGSTDTMHGMMQLSPEQQELATLAGTWQVTASFWSDPAAPPVISEATAVRTAILGGRVLEEIYSSTVMGQPFEGRAQTGYDRVTGRYWSVWIDNMNDGASISFGGWNEAEDLIIMEGEIPSLMMGLIMPVRIEVRMEGPDRGVHVFFTPDAEGTMIQYMELVYERE